MVNFSNAISDVGSVMPPELCSFYEGYYTMSTDMGGLIIKLGLLFASLDIIHYALKSFFVYIVVPFFKKEFKKDKKEVENADPL